MGFTSQDDFINEVTVNGKFQRTDWNKLTFPTTAHTAGLWYCLSIGAGNPSANTIFGTGTALAFQAMDDTIAGAIRHGGNVSSDTKHLLNASAFSAAATTMPSVLMLVDLLGFYNVPVANYTIATHTLTNAATLPRYTNGKGVMAFLTASGAALTAGGPSFQMSYTRADTGGTDTGRAIPSAPALPLCNATAAASSILHSGTGSGKFGPFLPLAAGDQGVESVQSITWSGTAYTTTGSIQLVLCKPLITLPMTTIGVPAERDFMNQLPSLPRIVDGAHLAWLMYAGAATPVNSPFYGHLDFGWG